MKKILKLFVVSSFVLISGPVFAAITEDLGTIVVIGSRVGEEGYKLTGNITVLTEKDIAASNANTVPEILKEAFGVHLTDNSTAKSAVVDIRGFGDTAARNTLILINNRKINTVDVSAPDLTQVPLESVERIEIIRGAGSVLYGDNAVGGVVNIVTKKGEGDLSGKIGATYGSYGAHSKNVQVSGKKDRVDYYADAKYTDKRGYRSNSDLLANDYNVRLGYDTSDYLKIDLATGYHDDTQELPGGLTETELRTWGRKGTSHDQDTAYTTDRYVQLSLDADPWAAQGDYGRFVVDLSYRNRDVYDEFNGTGFAFHTKRNIDTSGISAKYVFDKFLFNRNINFVTGIDCYDTENDILGSRSNSDDITISKEELGLFGFLEYELFEDIYVNGGTRYHQADYTFNQRNSLFFGQQEPDEWVSMGGMKYEYAPGSNLHWNVQQTFRFLATDEWYSTGAPAFGILPSLNTNLKQQTGIQYEAGVKHNFNDNVIASITPYYIDNRDEIFLDPVTFANSNYDKTRRFGVEFANEIDLLKIFEVESLDQLEFMTNFVYQDAEFRDGANDGKTIPMVPMYQAKHGFLVGFLKHYKFSVMGQYVGSRFAINDTLNATPAAKPFYVVDTKLAFTHDNFECFLAVNNIANYLYSDYVSKSTFSNTKSYFPAPERNITAGVSLKF